jgi:hypothetical protein
MWATTNQSGQPQINRGNHGGIAPKKVVPHSREKRDIYDKIEM